MSGRPIQELVSRLESLGIVLEADGDRLRVDAPKGALTGELTGELKSRKSEILAYLEEERAAAGPPPLEPRPRSGPEPLSFAQQRLWFMHEMEPASPLYNLTAAARMKGRLDEEALERALAEIVRRHESLRTSFVADEGRPAQVVSDEVEVDLRRVDLSAGAPEERDDALQRFARGEAQRPFDIGEPPLWSLVLARLGDDDHVLLLNIHHIVSDDWSGGVFVTELSALYGAFTRGEPSPLPELPVQYADFAVWQRDWLSGPVLERQVAYWRDQLAGDPPVLDLPTDRPRPPIQGYRGDIVPVDLPGDLGAALERRSREAGATPFMGLMATFQALLSRLSGQSDFAVGTAIANRTRPEIEGLIGFFVNTLVLRADLSDDPSFGELLRRVRDTALGAYDHQDLPFEKMVEELRPARDLAHSPFFQVMLVLETGGGQTIELPELEVSAVGDIHNGTAKFDLTLYLERHDDGYRGILEYATDLFDRATVERLVGWYRTLLASACADPARPVSELPLLADAERRRMATGLHDTAVEHPPGATLHGLFAAQAARTPDAVALSFGDLELTYRELDLRARRLAHHLRGLGVGPEVTVGLHLERSPEMMVGLLGVLQAGGAYLPLDPSYPAARLDFMVESSGARVILTHRDLADDLPGEGAEAVILDGELGDDLTAGEEPPPLPDDVAGNDLAYTIYTSGSTGQPKGVMIEHAAAVNFLRAMARHPGLDADDRLLAVTTLSFDISVLELFLPLTVGARVVLASRETAADGERLAALIADAGITVMQATPATWHLLLARDDAALPPRILCGGEALSGELAARLLDRGAAVTNMYGPTEATVWVSTHPVSERRGTVPIGKPIDNTRLLVLDRHLEPVPVGVPGELYIGGVQLARGYRGRPDLTAERFVPDPFAAEPGARLYHTGDLARFLPDGTVEFLGRIDHQVKIRGFRVELGEIESAIERHPGVARAVVIVREDRRDDQRLVAYVVPADGAAPGIAELRELLGEGLPEYMLPSACVALERFPQTPSGKVDRERLPAPEAEVLEREEGVAPRNETEERVAAIWEEVLNVRNVGIRSNFFDLGGHSLLLLRVHARLRDELGAEVSVIDLFRNPTIESLAAWVGGRGESKAESKDLWRAASSRVERGAHDAAEGRIAVVGLAGRFPGSRDLGELWRRLVAGEEGIHFFSDEELLAAGVPPEQLRDERYVKARGRIADPDAFDADFFGITPREAELMDPQHRLFLETAWHALESAGYDPSRITVPVGVFGGNSLNTYLLTHLDEELVRTVGPLQLMINSDKDFLTTRVSYRLDLRGPSLDVQTACSTSLVAVHLAVRHLQRHECDMALAGGATVGAPLDQGYVYQELGIMSSDGHCRAFDAAGEGTVFGDGVGVVVLKRLADALADGDHVHAVVRGTAINNDGSHKVGFTAPSPDGQAEVIASALADAGVEPSTLGYVEAHGTGTALGDPIEVQALTRVMREHTDEVGFCGLGSVKSNVGHLDAAAGIVGFIKTVLALEHGVLPASLHFERPNPELELDSSPFYVVSETREWERRDGLPRRAGVSSFGIGGTNAHVVLEEAPETEPPGPSREHQLLVLSARTREALETATEELARHLERTTPDRLPDVAYTLATGRRAFRHRRTVVCRDVEEAVAGLEAARGEEAAAAPGSPPPLAFLFTGQGAQRPGMGRELYDAEPVFREQIDLCAERLEADLGRDLRQLLFATGDEAAAALADTRFTQPALFAHEYALARLWQSWGIVPGAMLGHSIGEYVAACLAGVFSLEAALSLVATRGRLMAGLPAGAMLAVGLPEEELEGILGEGLSLAVVNAPEMCVASGRAEAVDRLARELAARGAFHRRLRTSHAFHSEMMEPILDELAEAVRSADPSPPEIPFVSNLTGDWISDRQAIDPGYWARQLRHRVRFADGVARLLEESDRVLLEVGPGATLAGLARQQDAAGGGRPILASLAARREGEGESASLLAALGELWRAGVRVDWAAFWDGQERRRVPLPTYPFERRRHWLGRPARRSARGAAEAAGAEPAAAGPGPDRAAGARKIPDVGRWFYTPAWHQSRGGAAAPAPDDGPAWLVLADGDGLGARIAARLAEAGRTVVRCRPGDGFGRDGDAFVLRPDAPDDWRELTTTLADEGRTPGRVVHAWAAGATPRDDSADPLATTARALIFLARALAHLPDPAPVTLDVVTCDARDVLGDEPIRPAAAALAGPCRVIPQELAHVTCRTIDVAADDLAGDGLERAAGRVTDELMAPVSDPTVAFRGRRRWVLDYEAIDLPAPAGRPGRLRPGGVYLITGGLGRIGLRLAAYLAREAGARLVLTGRSGLPDRRRWSALSAPDPDRDEAGERVAERIRRVREVEALGAQVLVLAADAADPEAMRRAVETAEEHFGRLDGVVHAAGSFGEDSFVPIAELEPAACERALRAKVAGVEALAAALGDRRLDFVLLASSLSAVLGGLGFAAYATGNVYLDAFAQRRNRAGATPWISLAWDAWSPGGEAEEAGEAEGEPEPSRLEMTSEEGIETFRRALDGPLVEELVVSTGDLQTRLDQWLRRPAGLPPRGTPARRSAAGRGTARGNGGAAPAGAERATPTTASETQEVLAEIWKGLIGVETVEPDDNFFDLGGSSLLALQLRDRVEEELGVNLPFSAFLGQSLGQMASQVQKMREGASS